MEIKPDLSIIIVLHNEGYIWSKEKVLLLWKSSCFHTIIFGKFNGAFHEQSTQKCLKHLETEVFIFSTNGRWKEALKLLIVNLRGSNEILYERFYFLFILYEVWHFLAQKIITFNYNNNKIMQEWGTGLQV